MFEDDDHIQEVVSAPGRSPVTPGDQSAWMRFGERLSSMRWSRLLRSWQGITSMLLLLLMLVGVLGAPWIAYHDPYRGEITSIYEEPSADHPLGTDGSGRDVFSRMLHGGRTSLRAGLIAVSVGLALGASLGLVAGYVGGLVDRVLSSLVDSLMSVPSMMLAMVLIVALGRSVTNAMLAVGVVAAPKFYRVTRAAVIDAKYDGFVEAAVMVGCSHRRILFRHIVPHCVAPIFIVSLLAFAYSILAEAGLSFLGLAATPPTASWGVMLAEASSRYDLGYLMIAPGLCLVATSLGLTLLGEAFRQSTSDNVTGGSK